MKGQCFYYAKVPQASSVLGFTQALTFLRDIMGLVYPTGLGFNLYLEAHLLSAQVL